MASKANITIDQGTTFSTDLTLTDEIGDPLDLTGYTANSQMRKWYTSSTVAATFTAVVNVQTAAVTLSLTPTETANIVSGRYVYDVEITKGEVVSRIVEGIATVTPQVTR